MCVCVCVRVCAVCLVLFRGFATPCTVAHWVLLSMGLPGKNTGVDRHFWNGLLCLSPGDFPDSGIEPMSLVSPALAGRFFITSATWQTPNSQGWFQKHCVPGIRDKDRVLFLNTGTQDFLFYFLQLPMNLVISKQKDKLKKNLFITWDLQ